MSRKRTLGMNEKDLEFQGLIYKYQKINKFTNQKMAQKLNMGKSTWESRKRNPGDFTRAEQRAVFKILGFKKSEIEEIK